MTALQDLLDSVKNGLPLFSDLLEQYAHIGFYIGVSIIVLAVLYAVISMLHLHDTSLTASTVIVMIMGSVLLCGFCAYFGGVPRLIGQILLWVWRIAVFLFKCLICVAGVLLAIYIIGATLYIVIAERRRRKQAFTGYCEFTRIMTEAQFKELVVKAVSAYEVPYLRSLEVCGAVVRICTASKGSHSEKQFALSFNNEGVIGGDFLMKCDFGTKKIAKNLGNKITEAYNAFIEYDPFAHVCVFPASLDPERFETIVRQAVASYQRRDIKILEISDATVSIAVPSISGKSEWSITLSFNDHGTLGSVYHVRTKGFDHRAEPDDERVSMHIGDHIAEEICKLLS